MKCVRVRECGCERECDVRWRRDDDDDEEVLVGSGHHHQSKMSQSSSGSEVTVGPGKGSEKTV